MDYSFSNKISLIEQANKIFGKDAAGTLWNQLGFPPIRTTMNLSPEQENIMGSINEFFDEHIIEEPNARIQARQLYEYYVAWAEGRKVLTCSETFFSKALEIKQVTKRKGRIRYYIGIKLKEHI